MSTTTSSDKSWNADDFSKQVIVPALKAINLYSAAAEQLVLGTALHESHLKYTKQIGGGPARGYFQMEKGDHDDIWNNFLKYHQDLAGKVKNLTGKPGQASPSPADHHGSTKPSISNNNYFSLIETNHQYAAAMCRVHYYRHENKAPLPPAGDIRGFANYWKKYYNSANGKGTAEQFTRDWDIYRSPGMCRN